MPGEITVDKSESTPCFRRGRRAGDLASAKGPSGRRNRDGGSLSLTTADVHS